MTAEQPPVTAWEYCRWEDLMVPVGHECVGDGAPECPTPEGHPCGVCPECLTLQAAWLAEHGETRP